jgi:hypothetical protein
MKAYIYIIFDLIKNKKYYVGKHKGNNKNYITGSTILRRYISLFGMNAFLSRFKKSIICYCNIEDLDDLETFYIKKYNTKNKGGNLTWGGKWDVSYRKPILKPIIQYDLNGNFIREWEYVKQPIEHGVGTDYNGISACCLGKQKSSNGFIWRFKETEIPLNITPPSRKKYKSNVTRDKYQSIEINGKIYKSITEAAKDLKWSFGKLNYKLKNNQIEYKWIK